MATAKGRVKQWASIDFSDKDALYLEIKLHGQTKWTRFSVSQFTCSYSKNTIPTAQCLVALGRKVRGSAAFLYAKIHTYGDDLALMCEARVMANIRGEITPGGSLWPTKTLKLFDGYYLGLGQNQVDSKAGVVLHLVHRSVDLACSSSVSPFVHQSSPFQLSARAVLATAAPSGANNSSGGAGAVFSTAQTASFSFTSYANFLSDIRNDWFGAVKKMMVAIASVKGSIFDLLTNCAPGSTPTISDNTRALRGLANIEGADKAYKFGNKISFAEPLADCIALQVRNFISNATVESWAYSTFWDKLVGELLPTFRLAYIPRAESDIVIADMPTYFGSAPWRELRINDYEAVQMQAVQDLPLRGIGVYGQTGSQTMDDQIRNSTTPGILMAGCYLIDSNSAADGPIRPIPAPPWLNSLWQNKVTTQLGDSVPTEQGIVRGNRPADVYVQDAAAIRSIFNRYAKTVFYDEVTKANNAILSGRLRFDIAPGSIVSFASRTDRFIKNGTIDKQDTLAVDRVGQVTNVSIAINADARLACTSFSINAMRNLNDASGASGDDSGSGETPGRTKVDEHPLFSKASIHGDQKHGAPLLDEFKDIST